MRGKNAARSARRREMIAAQEEERESAEQEERASRIAKASERSEAARLRMRELDPLLSQATKMSSENLPVQLRRDHLNERRSLLRSLLSRVAKSVSQDLDRHFGMGSPKSGGVSHDLVSVVKEMEEDGLVQVSDSRDSHR